MANYEKYKAVVVADEAVMSNSDLLEAVISLSGGDDYDGCFTDLGQWEFDYLKEKLIERLRHVGWLE